MALAIFDLDETLIDGDCASLWSAEMAKLGWVDGDSFLARDHELMTLYAEGKLAMEDYMAFSLSPLVGRSEEEVAFVVEPFVEDVIEPLLYSDAMRCLAQH
ncbi:HAD-IB family hydrolase, partial [Pseudomonas sp. CrR25]|nr:HAD-IB family hydrolase [Pseudomonas sp. CrR25]